jgi:hypothetical protein
MKFRMQVHFTGVRYYTIEADSLEEARPKAIDTFYDGGNEGCVYTTYGTELKEK